MSEYREDYEEETWQDVFLPKPSEVIIPKKQKRFIFKKIKGKKPISKKRFILISLSLIIVIAGLSCLGYKYLLPQINTSPVAKSTNDEQSQYTVETLEKGTPKYTTVLPAGKNINELGGWTRTSSPTAKDEVYTFVDSIGNVNISVSEQPLPDAFKNNTSAKLEELAKSSSSNSKVTKLTVGNNVAYIGTLAKGRQQVFFAKTGILILINPSAVLSNDDLANYINSLK